MSTFIEFEQAVLKMETAIQQALQGGPDSGTRLPGFRGPSVKKQWQEASALSQKRNYRGAIDLVYAIHDSFVAAEREHFLAIVQGLDDSLYALIRRGPKAGLRNRVVEEAIAPLVLVMNQLRPMAETSNVDMEKASQLCREAGKALKQFGRAVDDKLEEQERDQLEAAARRREADGLACLLGRTERALFRLIA